MNHRDLDTTEFKKLFDENSFVLIDVRTEDEFKLGHLKDAAHIDFYKDDFECILCETLDLMKFITLRVV